jgi:hypothetical protein
MTYQFAAPVYEKPEEGLHDAIVAQVKDLGLVELTYEGRTNKEPMVEFTYFLKTMNSEGQQFKLTERFTVKFGKKANLPPRLRQFGINTPGFDSEDIEGLTGTVMVVHNQKEDGRVFANIMKFTRKPGLNVSIPASFITELESTEGNELE